MTQDRSSESDTGTYSNHAYKQASQHITSRGAVNYDDKVTKLTLGGDNSNN